MIVSPHSPVTFHHPGTGAGLDGVVKITTPDSYGSGSLLYSGHMILTAAHVLLDEENSPASRVDIQFETQSGQQTLSSAELFIHPDYDPASNSFDIALIRLPEGAPADADRYNLFRSPHESGYTATLVGYGRQGNGETGFQAYQEPIRTRAENQLELTGTELSNLLGSPLRWQPDTDSLLIADFDSGLPEGDTLAHLGGGKDTGSKLFEGMIAPGDSGGPALINHQIAGVASYISRFNAATTDNDFWLNSSFGEVGFWQRVSSLQQWIDQTVQQSYEIDTYTVQGQVDTDLIPRFIAEGDQGNQQALFYLQYHGLRQVGEVVRVHYETKDGTATAGEDYLATSGTLHLYPGQRSGWIAVEILGDQSPEGDETFFLDIYHQPESNEAGAFQLAQNNTVKLTAMRTISDDDGWLQ